MPHCPSHVACFLMVLWLISSWLLLPPSPCTLAGLAPVKSLRFSPDCMASGQNCETGWVPPRSIFEPTSFLKYENDGRQEKTLLQSRANEKHARKRKAASFAGESPNVLEQGHLCAEAMSRDEPAFLFDSG